MKNVIKKHRGLTLLELMVTLAVVMIAVSLVMPVMKDAYSEANIHNQLRSVKSSYVRARSKAMEFTQPVLFTVDPDTLTVLAVRDPTRTGNFDSPDELELVVGVDVITGTAPNYEGIVGIKDSSSVADLPHWSKIPDIPNCTTFPTSSFIIHPDGRILDPESLESISGTFFYATDPEGFIGALHITAMGEVKMAFIQDFYHSGGDPDDWTWKEF